MKLLDKTVNSLLRKYVGGQEYFTALDKAIQHKPIVEKLFSIVPQNNIFIVSGKFGQFIQRLYPEKQLLILPGGLRNLQSISLELIADRIKHRDFVFVDDSYYLGRTRNVVRTEIERLKGFFKHTYTIYDGSKWKDKGVTSLFRYHERF